MAVTCSPSHFLFLVPVVRNCIILSAARTDLSLYELMYKFFYVQEFFLLPSVWGLSLSHNTRCEYLVV